MIRFEIPNTYYLNEFTDTNLSIYVILYYLYTSVACFDGRASLPTLILPLPIPFSAELFSTSGSVSTLEFVEQDIAIEQVDSGVGKL